MVRKKFDLSLIPPSPDLTFEKTLWQQGLTLVTGIDEAGRGALCGPVAAGVVILPSAMDDLPDMLNQVRDSKQMSPKIRVQNAILIKSLALSWAVGFAEAGEIDELGIAQATRLAVVRGINTLMLHPQHLLIDYIRLPEVPLPQTSLVKGDQRSLSIACASVLAKTTRDELMVQYDQQYPGYGFAQHKGYGTKQHFNAIRKLGICHIHRNSFAPFK
ncbi:MAG: ribonuclease HII [Anaerolineales bacterium]|nr:ribonuclease HII [Anaerolineales bacterium]